MLSGYLAKPQSMVIGLSCFGRLIATVFIVSSGRTFPSQAACASQLLPPVLKSDRPER